MKIKKKAGQKVKWFSQKQIAQKQLATGNWQTGKFSQGWYVAEATSKDKYGQDVKDVKYFQLYDMKAASLPAPAYTWNTIPYKKCS